MNAKFKKWLLTLLVLQLFLPVRAAVADTGPKPSMEFEFEQDSTAEPLEVISGILYECEESGCSDAAPLEELGPQRFSCEADCCFATAYGFAPYHRIEIKFSDGMTRQSNIFETAGFDSKYTVTIRPDDLLVEAQFSSAAVPSLALILATCICALAGVGLIVGSIIFLVRRSNRK